MELSRSDVKVSCIQPGFVPSGLHDRWNIHPTEAMGIPSLLYSEDLARTALFALQQPAHVRIPKIMILPKDHGI